MSHNKLNQELVIKQFIEVHGDEFDYSNVVYVNTHTPVEVYCKKHDFIFFPTPKNHKSGAKCTICGRESQIKKASKSKEKFIEDVEKLYGKVYETELVNYTNNKTDVKIKCSKHGIFEVRPDIFLGGKGCPKCSKKKTKSSDKKMFLEEVQKIHGDKNDHSETIIGNSRGKINVVCKEHGKFSVYMANYFQGQGCPKCSAINYSLTRIKTIEEFIRQAKEVHEDSCDYTNTTYGGNRVKIKAKCNIHNEYFETYPFSHLRGARCRKCLSERISKANTGKEGTCGYTRGGYVKQANGREACVYLIRCFNENEEFYKIGKTFLDIHIRFTKSNICYNFEVVHFHFGEAGYIYDLENKLHKEYKKYKYNPYEWFAGYTECFSLELPIGEIINL